MVKKCIECKYFDKTQSINRHYGRYILHSYPVKPDDTCKHFTENNVNSGIENEKLEYLEKRIEKLERIEMRLL